MSLPLVLPLLRDTHCHREFTLLLNILNAHLVCVLCQVKTCPIKLCDNQILACIFFNPCIVVNRSGFAQVWFSIHISDNSYFASKEISSSCV